MLPEKYLKKYDISKSFKPLRIIHGFTYDFNLSDEQNRANVDSRIAELKTKGFGGVVTNVSFNDYTKCDKQWELYCYSIEACKKAGMRVWLYDEKGYPSGGAGGLTLEKNPGFEACGVVIRQAKVMPGETTTLKFPHGHTKIIAAYTYKTENPDDADAAYPYRTYTELCGTQNDMVVINDTQSTLWAVCFILKPLYEGTHAQHNVCESRRYIDVSSRNAVAEFINNTYKCYDEYSHGDFALNGGIIEAIFTDEPSYMGTYINGGLYPDTIHDKFDDTIELLPFVNWGADVVNTFKSLKGYNILDNLLYLFYGNSDKAKRTRMDFYKVMSLLYEQSFFAQISDWCAAAGLPFSGHILLEDDLRLHTIFEGNFFSLLRHMHYPGIDMLHSIPEIVFENAFTPKLISSIAHTYGRPHVMSEVSAHAQGGKVTKEQMLCSCMLQYALGVDVFTSYYGDEMLETDEYVRWNNTIGRTDCIMGGGAHIVHIAMYYPIETMQANYTPPREKTDDFGKLASQDLINACWDSLYKTQNQLRCNQLDFDHIDFDALEACAIIDKKLINSGGEAFELLIIPAAMVTVKLERLLKYIAEQGVKIIALEAPEFANDILKLAECGIVTVKPEAITSETAEFIIPELKFDREIPEVVYLCRENEKGKAILMVNYCDKTVSTAAKVNGFISPVLYYPYEDTEYKTSFSINEDGSHSFIMKLEPYQSAIVVDCK